MSQNGHLTKDAILAGIGLSLEPLDFTFESGESVFLAKLTAAERNSLLTGWTERQKRLGRGEEDYIGIEVYIVAYCLCDADNDRYFGRDLEKGVTAVGKWLPDMARAAAEAAQQYNGMGEKKSQQGITSGSGD